MLRREITVPRKPKVREAERETFPEREHIPKEKGLRKTLDSRNQEKKAFKSFTNCEQGMFRNDAT